MNSSPSHFINDLFTHIRMHIVVALIPQRYLHVTDPPIFALSLSLLLPQLIQLKYANIGAN